MPAQLSYYLRFKQNVLPEGPDYFLRRFYYDTALSASPHCFSSLLTITDCSHIVFGTDYIFATEAAVPATISGIRNHDGFTAGDIRTIERETALTLNRSRLAARLRRRARCARPRDRPAPDHHARHRLNVGLRPARTVGATDPDRDARRLRPV